MREAVIVSSVRTAVGKAGRGTLRATRPDDLAATAIKEAISRAKGLEPAEIEDVIIGCATPEAEQGMNVARIASLRAGLPVTLSAMTINRFCSSGLKPSRSPPNGSSLAAQKSLSLAAPNPCP
jgi:acetyl-CoA acyltransferase